MNCPRVWDGVAYSRRLHPISVSVYQSLTPLSTCNMELTADDTINNLDWVEIQTPDGKAEYYRVANVSTDMATGVNTVYMEHGACVLGDIMIPEITQDVTAGTDSASSHGANLVVYPENKSGTVAYMLGYILGKQGNDAKWAVGDVDATDTIYMELGNYTLLDCLSSMMQYIPGYQMEFVQNSASDWRVNIKQRPTAVSCEGRLSRNLQSCEVSYSTANICTRVYVDGVAHDADTISTYGVHAESMTLNDNLTTAQKNAIIASYLSNHCHPTVSIDISAIELSQITGLDIDKFELGTVCRIAIPWLDVVENEIIIDKRYADCYNSPEEVAITLANATPDLAIAMAAITSTAGGAGTGKGGVAGKQKQSEKEYKRFETHFEQTDEYFRLLATDTDWSDMKSGKIGSYTQLVINSQTFQTVVSNERARTSSTITQTADSITSLVIGTTASDIFIGDGTRGELGKRYRVTHRDAQGNPDGWVEYAPVQTQITQNAESISTEVKRATEAEKTLTSSIEQEADRISLVVTKKDGANVINAASIVTQINNTTNDSSVILKADHIALDANKTTNISDILEINAADKALIVKNGVMTFGQTSKAYVNDGKVGANTLQVSGGGSLKFVTGQTVDGGTTYAEINAAKAQAIVTNVQVIADPNNANQYKLQYKDVSHGDTWQNPENGTFSRATTLKGGHVGGTTESPTYTYWDGGVLKVLADPQGNVFTASVLAPQTSTWGHWGDATNGEDPNKFYGKIASMIGTATTATDTGATYTVNASGRYQAGADSVKLAGGVWKDGIFRVSTEGKTTESELSTELSEIVKKSGNSSITGKTITTVCNVLDTNNAVIFSDSIDLGVNHDFAPTSNSANNTLTGTLTSTVNGAVYSTTPTLGYLRITAAGGNTTTDTMVVTGALRQYNYDDTQGGLTYAKGTTTVQLEKANTEAAALKNAETYSYGTAKVNAKVGTTTHAYATHNLLVTGSDIDDVQGSSEVTFSLDGTVVARKLISATYPGDASGNVKLDSIAAGTGTATYSQDTQKTYVSFPVDYKLSNMAQSAQVDVNTVKFPFGVTLTPSNDRGSLKLSATVTGTKNNTANQTLTVNTASFPLSNLYTLTQKTSTELKDTDGNKVGVAIATAIKLSENQYVNFATSYPTMAYVWAKPSAVTDAPAKMTVDSYLSNSTSTSGTHYAMKQTEIELKGTASIDPGGSSVVKAMVGNSEYASFTVTATGAPTVTGSWDNGIYTGTGTSDGKNNNRLHGITIGTITSSAATTASSTVTIPCDVRYSQWNSAQNSWVDAGSAKSVDKTLAVAVTATTDTITTATGNSVVTVSLGGVNVAQKTISANVPSSGGYGAATLHYSKDAVNYSQFNTADNYAPEKSVELNQDGKTVWGYLAVQQSGRNTQFACFKATVSTSSSTNDRVITSIVAAPKYEAGHVVGTNFTFKFNSGSNQSWSTTAYTTSTTTTYYL